MPFATSGYLPAQFLGSAPDPAKSRERFPPPAHRRSCVWGTAPVDGPAPRGPGMTHPRLHDFDPGDRRGRAYRWILQRRLTAETIADSDAVIVFRLMPMPWQRASPSSIVRRQIAVASLPVDSECSW